MAPGANGSLCDPAASGLENQPAPDKIGKPRGWEATHQIPLVEQPARGGGGLADAALASDDDHALVGQRSLQGREKRAGDDIHGLI